MLPRACHQGFVKGAGRWTELCRKPSYANLPREVVAMELRPSRKSVNGEKWPQLLLPSSAGPRRGLHARFFPAPRRRRDRAGNHVFVRSFGCPRHPPTRRRIVAGLPTAPDKFGFIFSVPPSGTRFSISSARCRSYSARLSLPGSPC